MKEYRLVRWILGGVAVAAVGMIMSATLGPTFAQNYQTGYLLSVWSGGGNTQTHAITAFEGPGAEGRCKGAAEAMRRHDNRFNSTAYTTCLPF